MIAVISCLHFPDDERIYHRQIKTLLQGGYEVKYYTRSTVTKNLSGKGLAHINFSDTLSISEYTKLVLKEISNSNQILILHIHEPELFRFAINVKKVIGAKIIYDVHEDFPSIINTFSKWNKGIKYFKERYWILKERLFLKEVDEIIVASSAIVNSNYRHQGFNPLLLENFPSKTFISNLEIKKKIKNSIIYHGNLAPERGIIELIKAMEMVIREIPDATLSLYGNFRTKNFKNNVCQIINRLNMNKCITLHAHILHVDIWKKLEEHMIGVIPFNDNALTRIGTPTKIFEFMAAGCQIVCSDLPPMKRYDIKGLKLFQSGNVKSLSNVLINSMKNISNKDLIYNQEKIKSDYNWDCISGKLINLYKRLLS
tara:strand:- start:14 stop:1123 length:1110 start_codon:yes stop_codon:yes gene_type:complete